MKITTEDFIVAYATSENYAQLRKTTGLTQPSIQSRVRTLEKAGVVLPKLNNSNRENLVSKAKMLNDLFVKHRARFVRDLKK